MSGGTGVSGFLSEIDAAIAERRVHTQYNVDEPESEPLPVVTGSVALPAPIIFFLFVSLFVFPPFGAIPMVVYLLYLTWFALKGK